MSNEEQIQCPHCKGKGECDCSQCAPSVNSANDCREEFDTNRQMECTCHMCNGKGKIPAIPNPLSY